MAITQLDDNTALIVIDLQYGIVVLPEEQAAQGVIDNTNRLIESFHHRRWPIVLANVSGHPAGRTDLQRVASTPSKNWTVLVDRLIRHTEDILITKRTWGAFSHSELHSKLQSLKVTQVVVVGIATSMEIGRAHV